MKSFFTKIKDNKEFVVGIFSLVLFLCLFTGLGIVFSDTESGNNTGIRDNVTFTPIITVTPTGPVPVTVWAHVTPATRVPTKIPTVEITLVPTKAPTSDTTGTPAPTDMHIYKYTPTPTFTPVPTSALIPTFTPVPTFAPTPTFTLAPTPTLSPEEQTFYESKQRLYAQYTEKFADYMLLTENAKNRFILPVINITTLDEEEFAGKEIIYADGKKKTADKWIYSIVDVFNTEEKYMLSADASVKVRGNASAAASPYPLRIKFDKKQSMLGLNHNNDFKNWVLLKPWYEVTTDYTAFMLGNKIYEDRYYISDGTYVNVFVNGKYYGLYLLCEQNQVKKKRINVNEPEDGDTSTSTGYLVEIDNYAGNDLDANPYFKVPYKYNGNKITLTDFTGRTGTLVTYTRYTIHSEIYSDAQTEFISEYINNAFLILYSAVENNEFLMFDENYRIVSANGTYNSAKDTISAVFDIESVVDTYLIEEIMGNYDRGNGSFYMCVDFSKNSKYKKLTFTAPWDFNWCIIGNDYIAGSFDDYAMDGKYAENPNPWLILFMKEEWFRALVAERINELYDAGTFDEVLNKVTDNVKSAENDFKYWEENGGVDNAYNKALRTINKIKARVKWLKDESENWVISDTFDLTNK